MGIMAELELADWDKACQEIEEDIDETDAMLVAQGKGSGFLPLSAETVLRKHHLADTARMEAKDVAAMSPSELVTHRRRLAHGVRVSPVLAALMEQIEEAQLNHA